MYTKHVPSEQFEMKLDPGGRETDSYILDVIAAVHLMNFPLREAERMKSAHGHFLEMIRTSRESWKLINAETVSGSRYPPETLAEIDTEETPHAG